MSLQRSGVGITLIYLPVGFIKFRIVVSLPHSPTFIWLSVNLTLVYDGSGIDRIGNMSSDPPSEVNENYPDFDYNRLQPPPEEWELYDIPDKTHLRNRALDLKTFKKLVKHHSWGIHVIIGERRTKERLLQVLKRIIFNQTPQLRPTWHEFISRNCDAGPRLLRRSYNALQISRNYPTGVPGQSIYLRPLNAQKAQLALQPSNQSIAFTHASNQPGQIETGNYPAGPNDSSNTIPSEPPGFMTGSNIHQNMAFDLGNPMPLLPINYDLQMPQNPSFLHPLPPAPAIGQSNQYYNPSRFVRPNQTSREQLPTLPVTDTADVVEAIERAVMSFPYQELQRHQNARQIARPIRNYIATSSLHLTLSTPRLYSTISHIRAIIEGNIPAFRFAPNGSRYPFRGRGPVSGRDTTPIDCAIVVGVLLDAGSTIADYTNGTSVKPSPSLLENAFLDALHVNWEVLSETASVGRRDEFRDTLVDWLTGRGLAVSPTNVWSLCTESFRQFFITYTEQLHPCACQEAQPSTLPFTTKFVTPEFQDGDAAGVDAATLLERFFHSSQQFNCSLCGSLKSNHIERKFGDLPWRLVVRVDQRTLLQSHAARSISFDYVDSDSIPQKATYRWLGGIYCVLIGQSYHFRVYWNDNERGEIDNGAIRVYDGTQVSGSIIGGLRATKTLQRIPPSWWAGGAPPLLFYEKIVNPTRNALHSARSAIDNILNIMDKGELVFQQHQGWHPHGATRRSQQCRHGTLEADPRASGPTLESFTRSQPPHQMKIPGQTDRESDQLQLPPHPQSLVRSGLRQIPRNRRVVYHQQTGIPFAQPTEHRAGNSRQTISTQYLDTTAGDGGTTQEDGIPPGPQQQAASSGAQATKPSFDSTTQPVDNNATTDFENLFDLPDIGSAGFSFSPFNDIEERTAALFRDPCDFSTSEAISTSTIPQGITQATLGERSVVVSGDTDTGPFQTTQAVPEGNDDGADMANEFLVNPYAVPQGQSNVSPITFSQTQFIEDTADLDTSNMPAMDDSIEWAFDFEAASAELMGNPNTTPPTTTRTALLTETDPFGTMFQEFLTSQQMQEMGYGMPYSSEPAQGPSVDFGDGGGENIGTEKRKRGADLGSESSDLGGPKLAKR
ncbi:hypothetical protein LOZ36_004406 [Ophidiomyces ophidiicola]|nr:hypothetical protein LOZ36_004406 [Ophidiomyces ophidiicola]